MIRRRIQTKAGASGNGSVVECTGEGTVGLVLSGS